MTGFALPYEPWPETESLPAEVILTGDLWQRGRRQIDLTTPRGRITAGPWHSGTFETREFTFGGTEWMHILSGTLEIETAGQRHRIGPGHSTLIPRGLVLRWSQPEPLRKLFLRWDGDDPDHPAQFWHSGMADSGPQTSFRYSRDAATWQGPPVVSVRPGDENPVSVTSPAG